MTVLEADKWTMIHKWTGTTCTFVVIATQDNGLIKECLGESGYAHRAFPMEGKNRSTWHYTSECIIFSFKDRRIHLRRPVKDSPSRQKTLLL